MAEAIPQSVCDRILEAAAEALRAAGKPPRLTTDRQRLTPWEERDLPAAAVYAVEDRHSGFTISPSRLDHDLTFRVELSVAGEPFDAKADPYVSWVVHAILRDSLAADGTLRALVRHLEPRGVVWGDGTPQTRVRVGALAVEFLARFRTAHDDLTTLA